MHRASTSMYWLTFRVHVTTPPQYGRNRTASLQARRFYRWRGEPSPACVVREVGLADYHWALPCISSVAIATQPVHRLQIRPIVHNPYHSPKLQQGPWNSVGARPRTDTQTDTQTRVQLTTIHFASSTTHAKCNKSTLVEK